MLLLLLEMLNAEGGLLLELGLERMIGGYL
jgi:hypothetical protein